MSAPGGRSYSAAMAQLGADDVQVDRLAVTFDGTSQQLTTAESTITALVRSLRWVGPDADVFTTRWDSRHARPADERGRPARRRRQGPAGAGRGPAHGQRRRHLDRGLARRWVGPPYVRSSRSWREMRRMRAEQLMRLARANSWAEDMGASRSASSPTPPRPSSCAWWNGLTDDQRAALLRNDPGALFGLEGLPADVRAEARADYIDSVRSDLEISSTEDKLDGGAEHRLGPPRRRGQRRHRRAGRRHVPRRPRPRRRDRRQRRQQGRQGPRRHRRRRRPELRVRLAGRGRGVRRRAVREADARRRLVRVRRARRGDGRHRRRRRRLPRRPQRPAHAASRASCAWRARSTSSSGPSRSRSAARPARRYDFDSQRDDAVRRRHRPPASIDVAGRTGRRARTGSAELSADLEVGGQVRRRGQRSASSTLGGTFGGEAIGRHRGSSSTAPTPSSKSRRRSACRPPAAPRSRFDAKLDLQDPIVQQRAADAAQRHGQRRRCSLTDLQALLGSPRCRSRSTP